MSLLFQDEHIEAIRDGEKTATRRNWDENYNRPKEGSIYMAVTEMFTAEEDCDCFIQITDVYRQRLGDMERRDYEMEGGYTAESFEEIWQELHDFYEPALVVDVVEFEYVGRERRDPQREINEVA